MGIVAAESSRAWPWGQGQSVPEAPQPPRAEAMSAACVSHTSSIPHPAPPSCQCPAQHCCSVVGASAEGPRAPRFSSPQRREELLSRRGLGDCVLPPLAFPCLGLGAGGSPRPLLVLTVQAGPRQEECPLPGQLWTAGGPCCADWCQLCGEAPALCPLSSQSTVIT